MAIQDISNLAIEDSFQGLVQYNTASTELGTALGATISSVAVTASFATTASYALNSDNQTTASYALSASVAERATAAGTADTAGSATTATTALSSSFAQGSRTATSASFSEDARTADSATSASFAENTRTADSATSASFAATASFVLGGTDTALSASVAARATTLSPDATASFADLASFSRTAGSASFAVNAGLSILANSASVAAVAITLDPTATASFADLASDSRTSTTASFAINAGSASQAVTSSITDSIKNGINATFNNIVATSGSFTNLTSVTSSVVITGDAFIQLNNDTPIQRYAGINVVDSGSAGLTSSFAFDGLNDNWFFEKDVSGATELGSALFGPTYTVKGVPTYNALNKILKGTGGHHIVDSSLTDNGVTVNSSVPVSASVFSGELDGNALTATTASHAISSITADLATLATNATNAITAVSSSYSEDARTADSATSASFSENARTADSATSATSASFAEDARTADSATSASYVDLTAISQGVSGVVNAISVASNTASIDFNTGNFFTLAMPAGGAVHVNHTNIKAGQTLNLRTIQNATPSTLDFNGGFKFESGSVFTASTGSGITDLMSFVTFDTSTILGTGINNLV